MGTFTSRSPEETQAFAQQMAGKLQAGSVIGLSGDLGAGKTQFVKGLARGLGVTDRVHSPTFALLNVYGGGRCPLFHIDLYRLETQAEIRAAGLEEYLTPQGISVIEWVDRWPDAAPALSVRVELQILNEAERVLCYETGRSEHSLPPS